MHIPLRTPIRNDKPFDLKSFDITGYDYPTNAEIEGIEGVRQITGFSNFADGEILKVLLDSSQYRGQSDLTVWILAETQRQIKDDPNSSSWYEVQITFYDIEIETLELWDFNMQNVISDFLVKRQDDCKLAVLMSSTFGCGYKLTCQRAKVLSMQQTNYRAGQRIDVESTPIQTR